jgi:hypothetical protein
MEANFSSFEIPQNMEPFHWATFRAPKPLNNFQIFVVLAFLLLLVGFHNLPQPAQRA